MTPPPNPAGPYTPDPAPPPAKRAELIAELAAFPTELRKHVAAVRPGQLDAVYRNWTARQIVHHLADSHLNGYVRTKWTLTEEKPTIKPYDESKWSALPDATGLGVDVSLRMLEAVHERWAAVWRGLSDADFARVYVHPEYGKEFTLGAQLGLYVWHGRHHGAMVAWIGANR